MMEMMATTPRLKSGARRAVATVEPRQQESVAAARLIAIERAVTPFAAPAVSHGPAEIQGDLAKNRCQAHQHSGWTGPAGQAARSTLLVLPI